MATQRVNIVVQARGTRRTERGIRRVANASKSAQDAINGFRNALVVLAGISAAKGLTEFIDTVTRVNNKIVTVTDTQAQLNRSFNEIREAARATRSPIENTTELYARFSRSTEELGLSQQELLDLTVQTNQAFQLFGATAQEASAATVQFSQGLAAGALRGDELRSVLEQAPRLAKAIAEGLTEIEAFGPETRVTIGDLRDLGKEGELTAQRITDAMLTQTETIKNEFADVDFTLSSTFVRLQNSFLATFREVSEAEGILDSFEQALLDLEPTVIAVAESLGDIAQGVSDIRFVLGEVNEAISPFTGLLSSTAEAAGLLDNEFTALTAEVAGFGTVAAAISGPIGLAVGSAVGLANTLGRASNSTTIISEANREFSNTLQATFDDITSVKEALEKNAITTRQQAEATLKESIARRENTEALRRETQQKLSSAEAEARFLLERGRDLQRQAERNEETSLVPGFGTLKNVFTTDVALIRTASEAEAAAKNFTKLREQNDKFAQRSEENLENIERLRELLASDKLVEGGKRGGVLGDDKTDAEKLSEKQQEAFARLGTTIDLIKVSAGEGSDALGDLRSTLDKVTEAEARNKITSEQASELREEIATRIGPAQEQAFSDVIASLEEERRQLDLGAQEQKAFNALKQAGLDISNLDDGQLARLEEEIRLLKRKKEAMEDQKEAIEDQKEAEARLEEIQRRRQRLGEQIRGNTDRLTQRLSDLNALVAAGTIRQQQFNAAARETNIELSRARLEAGEGNFADNLVSSLAIARGEFTNLSNEIVDVFGGALNSLSKGLSDGLAEAIVQGESLNNILRGIAQEALQQIISGLIQVGIQFLLNQAIAQAGAQAAVLANAPIAAQLATIYAPAAALASLASFGANAAAANAAILGTIASSKSAALTSAFLGFADGTDFFDAQGTSRSDSGLARLSRGEGVVTARANADNPGVVRAMNRGEKVGGPQVVNFNFPNGDVDSFRKSRRQVAADTRATLDRARR